MNDLPLRDIHPPDPISWWPLALGWWLVIVGIVLFSLLGYTFIKRLSRPTLKQEALLALEIIEKEYITNADATHCMSEMSILLRRVVVSQNGLEKSAGITGTAWLEFLDKQLDGDGFSQGVGQSLLAAPYQKKVDKVDVPELIQLCKKWVNRL